MQAVRVMLYHWNSMDERWAPTMGELHVSKSQYDYPFWKGKRRRLGDDAEVDGAD